jgi:outer membrane protein OmpA-like peptidoglycan-associated protein
MDTALNTLRDKNNTIKLTIPVQGNMADPKFDISDAINQALAKALKTGTLSYLKYALQPYGAMIMAAEYAGEAVTKVRLNPVEFEAGQETLTATGQEYLAKVAKVMRERPKIAIKLCGVAVQRDQLFFQQQQQQPVSDKAARQLPAQPPPAMDERKLNDLAVQRAAVVKDHLVEKHGIPAAHLVDCRPRIEVDKADAKPRTDLLI